MLLILIALIIGVALGLAPTPTKRAAHPATATFLPSPTNFAAETKSPTVEPSATASPTALVTPTQTVKPSPKPSSTTTPTATPTPTLTPTPTDVPPDDHYWLERPISPEGYERATRYYPYASRADGSYPIHHGLDFVNPMDTPILAVAPGTIIIACDDLTEVYGARTNFYGLLVTQEIDDTFQGEPIYILYGHLSEISVVVGQHVETGEQIGLVGMGGVAMGAHLHMEVRYAENDYGATVNPDLWVRPLQDYGTLAGLVLSPDDQPVVEAKIALYRADAPDDLVGELFTYPAKEVNPDPAWGENFASGDLPVGRWIAEVYHHQRLYTETITIESGLTTWLTIHTAQ
jgi:murein DD-endopeptidase MepM/ murein hydrolase activator NlpD